MPAPPAEARWIRPRFDKLSVKQFAQIVFNRLDHSASRVSLLRSLRRSIHFFASLCTGVFADTGDGELSRMELHGHAGHVGHASFGLVHCGHGDRAPLDASLNLHVFTGKGGDGFGLASQRIDFVADHERIARLSLDALLNTFGIGLARQHVLLATHGVADDSFQGVGSGMNLLDGRNHDGGEGEDEDGRFSHSILR